MIYANSYGRVFSLRSQCTYSSSAKVVKSPCRFAAILFLGHPVLDRIDAMEDQETGLVRQEHVTAEMIALTSN